MKGKTVKYRNKIFKVVKWIPYRLEWFEAELRDYSGHHSFQLRVTDLEIINERKACAL